MNPSLFAILRTVVGLFDRPLRRRVLRLLALMAAGAAMEMAGTALLLAFLGLVTDPAAALRRAPLAWLGLAEPRRAILVAGIAIAAVVIAKNLLLVWVSYAQHRFAQRCTALFAAALYRAYLGRPYRFHLERNSAELLRNLVNSVPQLFLGVVLPALEILLEGLRASGTVAVLLIADPVATAVVVFGLGALAWIAFRSLRDRLVDWGRQLQDQSVRCYQAIQQGLWTIKETKVLGREPWFAADYARHAAEASRLATLQQTALALPTYVLEATVVAGLGLTILVLTQAGLAVEAMAPILGVVAIAAFRLIPSINKVVGCLAQIKSAAAAVEHVAGDLKGVESTADPLALPPPPAPLPFTNRIRLDRLSFVYPDRTRPALREVSLDIPRGDTVALVGPSGAGKSTLADVILGLLPPSVGRILVDGRDIAANPAGWHAKIGYVPQFIYLTDASLRRNIALGLPDAAIDPARLARAVALARLDDVIAQLPQGLETPVGEYGVRLSGGQRQRVGIARALYHTPEILVLDEATSALDNVLEREVADAIARLGGDVTIILIAHRLSTARQCRHVVLMIDGRVADEGAFDELARRNPEMRRLVELGQLG